MLGAPHDVPDGELEVERAGELGLHLGSMLSRRGPDPEAEHEDVGGERSGDGHHVLLPEGLESARLWEGRRGTVGGG